MISPEQLRELLHALSSDDRDVRRPWASTPGDWWREGVLDADTADTLGMALSWSAMVEDDAGGIRAELLGSLAVLAEAGHVPAAGLDRLVTGLDAQWIPANERAHSDTLRHALGRSTSGRRDPKGYLWKLFDHLHALTSPGGAEREAAVSAAAAERSLTDADAQALAAVSEWARA